MCIRDRFVLGPALTMPLPMLATMVLRMGVGNGMGSYWIMGVSVVMSALIGLGWSLARRKYDAKEETAEESERQSAYRSYLQKNEALLQQRQAICRERLLRQYPSTPELVQKLTGGQAAEVLWNRNARAEDFTTVRLGLGRKMCIRDSWSCTTLPLKTVRPLPGSPVGIICGVRPR